MTPEFAVKVDEVIRLAPQVINVIKARVQADPELKIGTAMRGLDLPDLTKRYTMEMITAHYVPVPMDQLSRLAVLDAALVVAQGRLDRFDGAVLREGGSCPA